jgi:thiamine pyrophosphate-dependent acetolactate synthase large subunit-like protein
MVALSMADGYARLTGKPQCVIVHVDVGTQGLGAAVHNASTGRAPVLIFAGLSPYTIEGELRGSRTEYIHWIQDVPDQKQILAQYCRFTGEIKSGTNVKQLVNRALSFAMSDPKGPVYLYGAREPMEQEIEPYKLDQKYWTPVAKGVLPPDAVKTIAEDLAKAERPLVLTGYSGRNHKTPGELVKLADAITGLRVIDTGGCDMCFPSDHTAWRSVRFGVDEDISTADVILVLDCDVPWINSRCKPHPNARIYHIDVDPLKQQMPVFYIDALARYKADGYQSLSQLNSYISLNSNILPSNSSALKQKRKDEHTALQATISNLEKPLDNDTYSTAYLCSLLRKMLPKDTIYAIEAVTQTQIVADSIAPTLPGTWLNCGGGGLGWSGGAALGIKLAAEFSGKKPSFVCQIVGDGTFLFTVPASVYWISQRYKIPILTIVLNNNGWNAPKNSLLLVHPDGPASRATREDMAIMFNPTPDYAGVAKAASGGEIGAFRVGKASELESVLKEAIATVQAGTTVVIDAHLNGSEGKYLPK